MQRVGAPLFSPAMGAVAFLETKSVAVAPGAEAVASIRVRNTGTVVDQFTLGVLGDAQGWATVAPPTLSLFPGAEETAQVTFRPPKSADVPAGEMPFGIRVDSKEDPAGDVVEEGVVDIAPFTDTYAELAPRTSRGSRRASHDLAIDNRGNIRLNAQVTANDPDKALNIDVNPPGVVADPGTAAIAKVGVRPRKSFWRGPPQTHPFRVEVLSPGSAPVGVDGTMLQEAILPPWTVRALIAALAVGLLAVLAIWYLTGQAQQAAQIAARQELLAAGASVDPSSGLPVIPGQQRQDGKPTSPPATGGPNVTPTATGTGGPATTNPGDTGTGSLPPSPTPSSFAATSRDGRLTLAEPEELVPAEVTLYVTDLVFQNAGTTPTGQIIVGRRDPTQPANEVLLILQLENFRDLDFHWVTPLAFESGESLYLECPTGCQDAGVSWSGFQR